MATENSEVLEAQDTNEDEYDTSNDIKSWDDLDLDSNLLRGVFSYGFENPSPIQKRAIKPIILDIDRIPVCPKYFKIFGAK